MRKITVEFSSVQSIRKLILRFDRTELKSKAVIGVYAWVKGQKKQVGRSVLHEHQWIQLTKNPYHPEMATMFGHNQEWLNGFGIVLN